MCILQSERLILRPPRPTDIEAMAVWLGDCDGEGDCDGVRLGDCEVVGDGEGVGLCDCEEVGLGEGVGDGVGVAQLTESALFAPSDPEAPGVERVSTASIVLVALSLIVPPLGWRAAACT